MRRKSFVAEQTRVTQTMQGSVFPERVQIPKENNAFLLNTYLNEMHTRDPALHIKCDTQNVNYIKYLTVCKALVGGVI